MSDLTDRIKTMPEEAYAKLGVSGTKDRDNRMRRRCANKRNPPIPEKHKNHPAHSSRVILL